MHLKQGVKSSIVEVTGNGHSYISRINIPLNDIQDGDVASCLAGGCRDHTVFGLQEAPHDI